MQSSGMPNKNKTELDQFIDSCKSLEWDNLIPFLSSSVKDLSTKILASAVIQAHHPDATTAQKYGLTVWDSLLSAEPVTLVYSLYSSAVDLRDFTQAYIFASESYLNDPKVSSAIRNYIQTNQIQLAQYLDSDRVADSQKYKIHEVFGDLRISKVEKEKHYKKQFLLHAKQRIAAIRSIAQVNASFEKIFALKPSDFRVYFNKDSALLGVKTHSLSSPGSISFGAHIEDDTLQECAKKLTALKISANYYNMSLYRPDGRRGLQIWDLPQDIMRKLAQSSTEVEDEKIIPQKNAIVATINKSPNPFKQKAETKKENENILKTRVSVFCKGDLDVDDLKAEICQVIVEAIDNSMTLLLERFFGEHAYQDYLSARELIELNEAIKEEKISKAEGLYKYFNSTYLLLALYLACYKGSLKITQYLIDRLHLAGNVSADLTSQQKEVNCDVPLKGYLFKFAVQSGNLNLVKYLYEKTNAMIEVSVEQQQEKSPLMVAVECGHEKIVDYLLQHGANPNAVTFSDRDTAIESAIKAKNFNILRMLINAGAIVTCEEVHRAIKTGSDFKLVELLLQYSCNKEDPYEPYLLAAIASGNIALYKSLDTHAEIMPLDSLAGFDKNPMEKCMIMAAVSSGSLEMVQYLENNKKIDFNKWLSQENIQQEAYLVEEEKDSHDSMKRINNIVETISYKAAESHRRNNNIPLLHYLFEVKKLKPSEIVLKELTYCDYNNIQVTAYLLHFLENSPEKMALLRKIAFDLPKFGLADLFKTYNTELIRKGNPNARHARYFVDDMHELIAAKSDSVPPAELFRIVRQNRESTVGALFYYCSNRFDKKSEVLFYMLTQLSFDATANITVDVKNALGESLISYASWQRSYHIVSLLLMQGANPDLADVDGKTLINRVLDSSVTSEYFEWIQDYAQLVTNSIRYASKTWLSDAEELKTLLLFTHGDTQGIPIAELIENCLPLRNKDSKLSTLFIYLAENNAKTLVQLFRDPNFLQKNQLSAGDAAHCLSLFTSVDEKVLSKQDKARRLAAAVTQQFFAPAPPGDATEDKEEAQVRVGLNPPGGAPI